MVDGSDQGVRKRILEGGGGSKRTQWTSRDVACGPKVRCEKGGRASASRVTITFTNTPHTCGSCLLPRPAALRRATAMATPLPVFGGHTHYHGVTEPPHDPMARCRPQEQSPTRESGTIRELRGQTTGHGKNEHEKGEEGKNKDTNTNPAPVACAVAYSAAAPATAVAAGAVSAPAPAPADAAPSTSTPRPRSSSDAISSDDTMSSATLLAAARSSSTRAT